LPRRIKRKNAVVGVRWRQSIRNHASRNRLDEERVQRRKDGEIGDEMLDAAMGIVLE